MSIIVKNLIDGSWEDAVSGRTFGKASILPIPRKWLEL